MSAPSAIKHTLKHKDVQPRQKRFKVGKACFTCRVKKIKCDGLQPCMQCKARSRPCSFSKDGISDSNDEHDEHSNHNSPAPSPITSPIIANNGESPKATLTKKTTKINTVADNTIAMEILNRLCKASPGEGREVDLNFQKHPVEHKQVKMDLPTKSIQQHLIQLYFKNCYSTFPIIPKRLFYKHFDSSSTKLLTSPILLFMIFAHGAQYQQKTFMDADGYFQKAKVLLDEEMNYPSFGTTIALTLMSLYESAINQCSSTFSAMAFQMSLDLGLMRNYNGEEYSLTLVESKLNIGNGELMELKKRVCWGCYYLDKVIHIQSGQPWILRSRDIELDMPLLQPGDDVTEHEILEGFVTTIKLWQIAERILQPQSLQQIGQPVIRTHTHDQMSLNNDNELLHWLRSLPLHLQWTPLIINSTPPTPDPPSNPLICQIHLIYNLIELYVLKPYASSTVKSIHQRSIAIATNITRLIATLADNPSWIFSMTFTVNSLFESTKFHLRDCAYEVPNLARHARYMFQRSMHSMKTLLILDHKRNSITTKVTNFLSSLDQALTDTNMDEASFYDQTEMNEDDIMTPFVLGSLNSRHVAEEERQQWSKLDYFANGLITPPTVKSKANLYYHPPSSSTSIITATPTFNPPSISMYHHSAATDNTVFQSSWRATMTPDRYQYSRMNNNPLDFLSSEDQAWQSSRNINHKSPSSVNNSPKQPQPFGQQQQQQQQTPAELLLNQTDQSGIAALVAQIRDNNKDGNTSSNTSDTNQDDWNTTSSTSTAHIVNDNATTTSTPSLNNNRNNSSEDLLYTLLSEQQQQRQDERLPESQRQTQAHNRQNYNSFVTYPYTNVGLGIYASAHQHHNDVIRQHLPTTTTTTNTAAMIRPGVIVTDNTSAQNQ
ncbi:unnamed protein product [Mucor hiemalis]